MLESSGWSGDVDGVLLCVHEAIMNSMHHAGGATSAVASLGEHALIVEVSDQGPGFDADRYTTGPPDPLSERGRGLWLISRIAAHWEVRRAPGGTCLRLLFPTPAIGRGAWNSVQPPLGNRTTL